VANVRGNFRDVTAAVGVRPQNDLDQNASRHYSETFSKQIALWLREKVIANGIGAWVLPPEGKVDTIYGVGNRGKSLDVGVLDDRRYLLLNISIKTFNFKDRRTRNYRHNYTGRFYELLGEELDLRRSYKYATLVAFIFLPDDSLSDTTPSSFAHAVRQFSKIASRDRDEIGLGFDFVFVAVHSAAGELYFFNSTGSPPRNGAPPPEMRLSIDQVLAIVTAVANRRRDSIADDPLPVYVPFRYLDLL